MFPFLNFTFSQMTEEEKKKLVKEREKAIPVKIRNQNIFVSCSQEIRKKHDFVLHGGTHTTFGADWAKDKWDKSSPQERAEITFDKRWEAWPARVYAFKEKPEEVRDILLFLAEMDNQSYQIVRTRSCALHQ